LKAMSAFTTAVKNPNLEVFMKASYWLKTKQKVSSVIKRILDNGMIEHLRPTHFYFRPLTLVQSFFYVRHPRCVASITKNFCVLHNTVEHNYISSSSTLWLQLHVSALYVGHLQVVTWLSEQLYKMWGVFF
jgi:hypothetical protein